MPSAIEFFDPLRRRNLRATTISKPAMGDPPRSLAAVFLDVDGVIDSRKVPYLEATKVERLRRAVAEVPNCVIVVSSHWRLVPKLLTTLSTVLQHVGIHVIGVTPSQQSWQPKRPLEIVQWLQTYNAGCGALGVPPITAFVTVDDRDLLNEEGGAMLRGRAVLTSRQTGLQQSDADQIVAMLSAQQEGRSDDLPPVPGVDPACLEADAGPPSEHKVVSPSVAPPFVVRLVCYPPAARSGPGSAPCRQGHVSRWRRSALPRPPGTTGLGSGLLHALRRSAAAAVAQRESCRSVAACGAAVASGGSCRSRAAQRLLLPSPAPSACQLHTHTLTPYGPHTAAVQLSPRIPKSEAGWAVRTRACPTAAHLSPTAAHLSRPSRRARPVLALLAVLTRLAVTRLSSCCALRRPGPEYWLRLVVGATAPGGLRGAPPPQRPKALVDDGACVKRVTVAERWSMLWRHRHAIRSVHGGNLWKPKPKPPGAASVSLHGGTLWKPKLPSSISVSLHGGTLFGTLSKPKPPSAAPVVVTGAVAAVAAVAPGSPRSGEGVAQ